LENFDAALPMLLNRAGSMSGLLNLLKTTEPWSSHFRIVEEHLACKGWLNAALK
jgi:hypothetical protein